MAKAGNGYSPEDYERLVKGEITLRELEGVSLEDYAGIAQVGHTLLDQGKVDQARTVYEGLRAMDPNHAYVRATLGAIYMRENRDIDALEQLNEALRLEPDSEYALVNRGEILLKGGFLAEAGRDFKRCIELDPNGKSPAAMRARALVMVVKDMLDNAAKQATA
ncbi:MAG: tetratricopeptide repeat protein [Candidatus Schekmanbacteria bacterium]|nr:tetratricopeptide repeat protein [Candidatus Schekmanbacteria bacterium]